MSQENQNDSLKKKRGDDDDYSGAPAQKEKKTEDEIFKCIVRGIPSSFSEEELKAFFSEAGEIVDFFLKAGYDGSAFAIIGFPTEENLAAALKLNGEKIGESEITVQKKGEKRENNDAFKCYVKGLPLFYPEEDLKAYFSEAGEIIDCYYKVAEDGFGFAFIGYKDEESVQAALKFNGQAIGDAVLFVDRKTEKRVGDRGRGGGRGGHRGGERSGGRGGGRGGGGFGGGRGGGGGYGGGGRGGGGYGGGRGGGGYSGGGGNGYSGGRY